MRVSLTLDARVDPDNHPSLIDLRLAILEALGDLGLFSITLDLEEG